MEIGRGNGHGVVPMSGQWQPFNRQEHAIHRPEPEPKTTRNCLDVRPKPESTEPTSKARTPSGKAFTTPAKRQARPLETEGYKLLNTCNR